MGAKIYSPMLRFCCGVGNTVPNIPWKTTTLNVHEALLPDPSVKVYVTWVVPTEKNCPGLAVLDDNEGVPLLSVAVGSTQVTVVPPTPLLTVLVTSLMQAMVGGMVSTGKRRK